MIYVQVLGALLEGRALGLGNVRGLSEDGAGDLDCARPVAICRRQRDGRLGAIKKLYVLSF